MTRSRDIAAVRVRDNHTVLAATRRLWAGRLALPIGFLALVGVARLTPDRSCKAYLLPGFARVVLPASVASTAYVQICVDGRCQQATTTANFSDPKAPAGSWYVADGFTSSRVTVRVIVADPAIDASLAVRTRKVSVDGGCQRPLAALVRYEPAAAALVAG